MGEAARSVLASDASVVVVADWDSFVPVVGLGLAFALGTVAYAAVLEGQRVPVLLVRLLLVGPLLGPSTLAFCLIFLIAFLLTFPVPESSSARPELAEPLDP